MSLFQCDHCGCCENTAIAAQAYPTMKGLFDWSGIESRQDMRLCSACGPTRYSDGAATEYSTWHGLFDRVFLPMSAFKTNKRGNLEHIETGSEDFRAYALTQGEES